jgi:hypothetical protein
MITANMTVAAPTPASADRENDRQRLHHLDCACQKRGEEQKHSAHSAPIVPHFS